MKLLTLKKAQLQLEKTKGDYERSLKLLEQGLTSEQEFALVKTAYQQSQVDFQQALINFMGSEARINVASAVKYQDAGGKKFVRVTLRYSSKELKQLDNLHIKADDLFPLDFMKELKDVSVSLKSRPRSSPIPTKRPSPDCRSNPSGTSLSSSSRTSRTWTSAIFYSARLKRPPSTCRRASAPTS